jgi:TP901 family phage tail tape measure protein
VAAGEKIGEGYVEARLSTDKLKQDTSGLEQSMSKSFGQVGQKMTDVGKTMTRRMTAPLLGIGGAVLKVAGNFESSMNQVRAVTGATGADFDGLRNQAQDLGRTTQFSASQAADAMYFLASAGFDTKQVMEAMPGVLQLAAAAQMDLATATDIASNILSAFGLEAEDLGRVNDVLVATFQATNTNVEQLGEAMKYAAPVAAGLGVDIEDAAAAIGMMGNAGIQGSEAGTALRGAMVRLAQETGPVADKMRELGINAMDAEGNLKPLDEIIRQLEQSGASTADMMDLFGLRAGPAMMALVTQGSDALGELSTNLRDSGGIAEHVANVQMEGFNGAMARLKSAAEGAAIAIGDAGLLSNAANFAETIAEWFQSLSETNPELLNFGVMVGGIAAAVGPATWAIGGMVTGFGKILTVLNPVTIALGVGLVAIGLWAKAKSDARQRVKDLVDTLDVETGSLTDNTRALYENRLESDGLMEAADKLGISRTGLVDALMGEGDVLELVKGRMAKLTGESQKNTDSMELNAGVVVEQDEAYRTLVDGLGLMIDETEKASAATAEQAQANRDHEKSALDLAILYGGDYATAVGAARSESDELGGTVAGLGDEFADLTGEVEDATSALKNHEDTLRAQNDPLFALHKAIGDVAEAEKNFNEVLGDSESTQRDVEQAALDLTDAQLALMGASGEAAGTFDGKLDPALRRALENLGATDEQLKVVEKAFGEASTAGDEFAAKDYRAFVAVDRKQAEESMTALERRIAYLVRPRTFAITATLKSQAFESQAANLVGSVREKRAAGGPVWPGERFLVGEEGPEVVEFGGYGHVYDANTSRLMLSGVNTGGMSAGPVGGGTVAGPTYSPTYIINGDPSPDTLAKVRHRERVAYMEMR